MSLLLIFVGCASAAKPSARAVPKAMASPQQSRGWVAGPGELPPLTPDEILRAHPEIPRREDLDKPPTRDELEPEMPSAAVAMDPLEAANRDMVRGPERAQVMRALMRYPWDPTEQYIVYCKRGARCMVLLEPGEMRTEEIIDVGWGGGWGPYKEIEVGDGHGGLIHSVTFQPGRDARPVELTLATNLRAINLHLVPRDPGKTFNLQVQIPMLENAREKALRAWEEREREKHGGGEHKSPDLKTADACESSMQYPKVPGLGSQPSVSRHMPRWGQAAWMWTSCTGSLGQTHLEFPTGVSGRAEPTVRADCPVNIRPQRHPGSPALTLHLGCLATYVELSYCDGERCEGVTFCEIGKCRQAGLL